MKFLRRCNTTNSPNATAKQQQRKNKRRVVLSAPSFPLNTPRRPPRKTKSDDASTGMSSWANLDVSVSTPPNMMASSEKQRLRHASSESAIQCSSYDPAMEKIVSPRFSLRDDASVSLSSWAAMDLDAMSMKSNKGSTPRTSHKRPEKETSWGKADVFALINLDVDEARELAARAIRKTSDTLVVDSHSSYSYNQHNGLPVPGTTRVTYL